MMSDKCGRCGKSVYFAEKANANGKSWHKHCLTCYQCNKRLDSTNLTNREDEVYCKCCYGKFFGPKGYGYGGGAGTLSMDTGIKGEYPITAPLVRFPTRPVEPVKGGCPRCGGRVYPAEKMTSAGQNWHSFCFSCAECSHKLDSTTVCDHEEEIYCKSCYGRLYGPKGYGFGLGAGTLTQTGK